MSNLTFRIIPVKTFFGHSALTPYTQLFSTRLAVSKTHAFFANHNTTAVYKSKNSRFFHSSLVHLTQETQPTTLARPKSNLRRVGANEDDTSGLQTVLRKVAEVESGQRKETAKNITSNTQQTRAFCTAEEYSLPILSRILSQAASPKSTTQVLPYTANPHIADDVIHISVSPSVGGGEIFAFSNGTFVSWGVEEATERKFLDVVIRDGGVEIGGLGSAFEVEDYEFVVDEEESTKLYNSRIILNPYIPNPTLSKLSFSHGLARSSKLSVLESLLEKYLSSTKHIPHILGRGRKLPMGRQEILIKMGELLTFRQQLNLSAGESFLDTPDFYWTKPELEEYYTQISRSLDVRPRIAVLNKKLDYANELATVLREHLSEKHALALEWMIIILITVEVGFELVHWFGKGGLRKREIEVENDH